MNYEYNIEDLLRKFTTGNLSPLEAKEFAKILKQGDNNDELKKMLTTSWENTENTNIDTPTYKLLERLKAEIKKGEIKRKYSIQRKAIYTFMKYASVVIITFGLTWFAKDFTKSTPELAVLPEAQVLHQNEVSVLYGSKSKITLPDGSTVNLNSGSVLRYPAHFNYENRSVTMEGEAYFDVKKDTSHPFYVKTNGVTVRVLGTKFNVKSYPDEKTVEMTLVTGKIELYANNKEINDKNRLLVLAPNEQAVFNVEKGNNDSIVKMEYNKDVDVTPIISWKDNRLMFKDEKLINLAQKMERWYNVDIDIQDEKLRSMTFSGVFVKETIEQSLNALKLAAPFRYKMEKNKVIILSK
ncbi:MAG: FecR domain-containing protein [Bacteroidales bacterium]|nr:FecR domain-containing protein [Bacteroidales bacterium]